MDVVLRLLIGVPIFMLLGAIWFFLFNLLTGLVNVVAMGAAKGLRALLGVRGSSPSLGSAALVVGEVGKTLSLVLFWIAVAWYAFLFPIGENIAAAVSVGAFAAAFLIWTPALFASSLFISVDDL